MLDPVMFGKAMAEIVNAATAPLLKRIEQLEARQPERGEKGETGLQGDAGMRGEAGATGEKGDAGERGQQGDKGDSGTNGRDAEPIDIKDVIAEILSGAELKTLVDLHVAESVQKHFEANPIRHGKDGEIGKQGEKGDTGEQGRDGAGLADALIDNVGNLVLTMTDGRMKKLGNVVGIDGRDGARGADGADFSEVTLDYDEERGLVIRGKGGVEIIRKIWLPSYKGYWREGMVCSKANIVTHNGSAWIAIKDTTLKPCLENSTDWQLFVRKGRDGADGVNGRNAGPPPPVKLNG